MLSTQYLQIWLSIYWVSLIRIEDFDSLFPSVAFARALFELPLNSSQAVTFGSRNFSSFDGTSKSFVVRSTTSLLGIALMVRLKERGIFLPG